MATVPIVLAGAVVGVTLTGPVPAASAATSAPQSPKGVIRAAVPAAPVAAAVTVTTAAGSIPAAHVVQKGDTVSTIAAKYGLGTQAVLTLNGLGWRSLIYPGQSLKLTSGAAAATPVATTTPATSNGRYTIVRGDTVSGIAARFGVSTAAVLTANGLSWSSIIYPGQSLTIPGTTATASTGATTLPVETVSNVTPVTTAPAETAPVTTAPAVSTPTTTTSASSSYTIARGDTVTSIASKFGVTVSAILAANGLTGSSIIYAGRTLTIPGVTVSVTSTVTPLSSEMAANARIIIDTGRQLGVPEYGLVIALAAAMQESSLRNIDYGDRDSVGLFQQRPSTGWGTVEELTTPSIAATRFYVGRAGYTRGLLGISGWQNMTVTKAAQAVQISAFPDAYAKWETSARAWLAQLG